MPANRAGCNGLVLACPCLHEPARSPRRSTCRIALWQVLKANEGVVQRGQDHFAISPRTCMFCQSATRSIAVLRPLQSTASVIVASASAASLRSVRRLQRCAQWAPQQVGGHSPAGVAAARRRPRERYRLTPSTRRGRDDAADPPARRARRRGTAAARDTHNNLEATKERRRHLEPPAGASKVVRLPAPIKGRRGRRFTNRRRERIVR